MMSLESEKYAQITYLYFTLCKKSTLICLLLNKNLIVNFGFRS